MLFRKVQSYRRSIEPINKAIGKAKFLVVKLNRNRVMTEIKNYFYNTLRNDVLELKSRPTFNLPNRVYCILYMVSFRYIKICIQLLGEYSGSLLKIELGFLYYLWRVNIDSTI